ncbi:fungal specific transcription factor domain-containing protein [Rhodotorula paludigena]|uniref:fungal specific transcription factor domain-containing protein n=1 Tax=Rhodotorula paludigena TaxID=86838 RepID=UPI0031710D8D
MLLVAPQTKELALYCLNQRSSAALVPNPPLARPTRDAALDTYNAIVAPFVSTPEKPSASDALEESAPQRLLELVGHPAKQPESAGSGDFRAQHADAQQVLSSETQWAPQDTLSSLPSPPSASPSFRSPMARLLGDVAASERTRATQLSTALPPLPPQDVMDSLLDIYFSGPAHLSFPILDRDAILSTSIPVATSSTASTSKLEATQRLEALWAVLATAATQAPAVLPDTLSPDIVRAYAHAALSAAVGRPVLETVQAAVLLVSVDLHVGDVFAASAHFGMLKPLFDARPH